MKKTSDRKNLSPLERRLRSEAAAWSQQVQKQPQRALPPSNYSSRRRTSAHWVVLACSFLLAVVGLAYRFQSNPISPQIRQSAQTHAVSQSDIAALQATNVAIQKVFGSAAENTRKAVDRQLVSVNRLANQSSFINSVSLKAQPGDAIRKWALEPGRQYGAAAQWFDTRLDQLGDSSLSAARRLLNRGGKQPARSDSIESS